MRGFTPSNPKTVAMLKAPPTLRVLKWPLGTNTQHRDFSEDFQPPNALGSLAVAEECIGAQSGYAVCVPPVLHS